MDPVYESLWQRFRGFGPEGLTAGAKAPPVEHLAAQLKPCPSQEEPCFSRSWSRALPKVREATTSSIAEVCAKLTTEGENLRIQNKHSCAFVHCGMKMTGSREIVA